MKNTKKATSIVEAIIVLLIIVTWITWLYNIFNESTKLSNTTKNRIEAIEIAREGIEAMKNIRDTNWLIYGSDTINCFNTLNYEPNCVWWWWTKIWDNKSYKIYQNKSDFKWYLDEKSTWSFSNITYRDNFRVYKDSDWYYTQSGSIDKTIFTREIKVSYSGGNDLMDVKSVVHWTDSSKKGSHKVELDSLISNWKQN